LQARRRIPLTARDSLTYHRIDSIGEKLGLASLFNQTWNLLENRLAIGPVDVLLNRLMTANRVENVRLGIGLATNEKLSRRVELNGFFGYGIRDRAMKYGGGLQIRPLGDERLYLGGFYARDLVESGHRRIGVRPRSGLHLDFEREYGSRTWYVDVMETIITRQVYLGARPFQRLEIRFDARDEMVLPAYDYSFEGRDTFHFVEAVATLRWMPGAVFARQGRRRFVAVNTLPTFTLRYTRGLDTYGGEFPYQKAEFSIDQTLDWTGVLRINYHLHGGHTDTELPRSRWYTFRSNYARGNFADVPNGLNTMRYNEFAAGTWAVGRISLTPRLRWLRIGRFAPQPILGMAAAWGRLDQNLNHTGDLPIAPEQGYYEGAFSLRRLFPIPKQDNLLNSYLQALYLGAFYRFGPYGFADWRENVAVRMGFSVDF
ncbi:MAG: hypothetical protein AAF570_24285, partial [Bacteroidota bacterium]